MLCGEGKKISFIATNERQKSEFLQTEQKVPYPSPRLSSDVPNRDC